MRQWILFLLLVTMVLVPFFLWGDAWTERFSLPCAVEWVKSFGFWSWLVGIVLLISDLVLPVPGTVVMSALGFIYGPVAGSLIAITGSFLSGAVGYWLCRLLGVKTAKKILGTKDFERGHRIFSEMGGWIVVLSRWLPVFPEVVSCMAGLNQMPVKRFHAALLCSAIPMGMLYACIGAMGVENPTLALILSACVPPVIWIAVRPYFKRKQAGH